nr:hypothetical protein [Tanacetum cinerariifolium]
MLYSAALYKFGGVTPLFKLLLMFQLTVTRPRHANQVVTKSKSPIQQHLTRNPSLRTSNPPPRVNAVQVPVVSAAQGKQGTWGNPQLALQDKGVIDSRCSRHMTGNMSYLSNFEELNGGYVAFGGNPKGEDAAFDGKEHDFDVKKPESKVILFSSSSAQSKEQDDKTMKEAKGKSPVKSVTGYRDLNAKFQDCSENSSNEVTTTSSTVPTVGQNSLNNTNTFSVAGLEDIIYSDDEDVVGAEADFNNLESSIPVSPILTTRIHKDHHVSQIIGDLSSTTQIRRGTQEGTSSSQNPSWIEAMQEELLQFKM